MVKYINNNSYNIVQCVAYATLCFKKMEFVPITYIFQCKTGLDPGKKGLIRYESYNLTPLRSRYIYLIFGPSNNHISQ